MPVEQGRQLFDELKGQPLELPPEVPKAPVKRKLRIPATKQDA